MDGFLNVLKPPGMTSSDVVVYVRKMLDRGVKVGHGGTLDPDASGVLPICVGRATRLFDYFIDKEKEYIAELSLGVVTDTQDATGRVLERRPVTVDERAVREALPRLTGEIMQCPPAFSAIKRDGKRLYQLARDGEIVQTQPRPVTVLALDYMDQIDYNLHRIRIVCKKGVYVRTLMHDLGQMLGVGGHMSFLLRSRAGVFDISQAVTLEELSKQGVESLLMPLDAPVAHLRAIHLDGRYLHAVKNGNPICVNCELNKNEPVRVYLEDAFAGIGQAEGEGLIRFRAMLLR